MKSPNGAGSITRLSGKRRRPYRVRITTGFETDADGRARQIQRTLGTFATYQEAADALAAYHRNPFDLDPGVTFAEVYARWSAEKYQTVSPATVASYTAAYNAVPMLHDIEFRKLRRNHLQNAVDTCGKNLPTLQNVRILLGLMYKYAMQNDLVEKNYSRFVDLTRHRPPPDEEPEPIHTDIKPEELSVLWARADYGVVPILLMLIYSGLRISEFFALTAEDIDIAARFAAVRKSKTASGRRRVPLARKTLRLWEDVARDRAEHPDYRTADQKYKQFHALMKQTLKDIGIPEHLPHDTRHTTASMLHAAGVDPYIVKRILGHAVTDLTEAVYTHISDAAILEAIDRI